MLKNEDNLLPVIPPRHLKPKFWKEMNADFRDLSVDVDQVYLDRQVSILTAIAKSESPKYEAS